MLTSLEFSNNASLIMGITTAAAPKQCSAVQQQGEGAPHTAVAVVARWFVNIIVLPIAITFEKQSQYDVRLYS